MTDDIVNRRTRAQPWWTGYLVTVTAEAILTVCLRLLLPVFPLANFPIPYVLVMMMVAYLFGEGPAILAFILGFVCFAYFFPPYHGIWPPAITITDWAGLAALLIGTAIVGFATAAMRRSSKRSERLAVELQQANQQTRNTLESIAACCFVLDSEWRFIYINRIAEERVFERPANDLLGQSYLREYPQAINSEFYRKCST